MTHTFVAFGITGKTTRSSRYVLVRRSGDALLILKGSDTLATIQKARTSRNLSRWSTVIVDLG